MNLIFLILANKAICCESKSKPYNESGNCPVIIANLQPETLFAIPSLIWLILLSSPQAQLPPANNILARISFYLPAHRGKGSP
jgi:hypothetical protein